MEFHVFSGIVGPLFIAFHFAFMLRSPVGFATSLSLTTLVLTGIIGRYIYAQAPHTITGAEATVASLIRQMEFLLHALVEKLGEEHPLLKQLNALAPKKDIRRNEKLNKLRGLLWLPVVSAQGVGLWIKLLKLQRDFGRLEARHFATDRLCAPEEHSEIFKIVRKIALLRHHTRFLLTFHELFSWWRGLHGYFAIVMVLVTLLHVVAALYVGARWIF